MRVRLALGGGGVRGFFHLGLLKSLKDAGVEVEALAGTSAGALAAAAYAFGLPLEVRPILDATQDPELLRLQRLGRVQSGLLLIKSFRRLALVEPDKYRAGLEQLFQGARIEDAHVPLTLLAADLLTGEPVYLRSGPVVDAVLASGSIPGIFPPVPYQNRLLVDGDVVEKVPTSALVDQGRAPLVAVDVSNPGPENPPKNSFEAVLLAGEASRRRLKALALERADHVVRLPLEAPIGTFDFQQAEHVYRLGEKAGRELLEKLRRGRRRFFFRRWWKTKHPEGQNARHQER